MELDLDLDLTDTSPGMLMGVLLVPIPHLSSRCPGVTGRLAVHAAGSVCHPGVLPVLQGQGPRVVGDIGLAQFGSWPRVRSHGNIILSFLCSTNRK